MTDLLHKYRTRKVLQLLENKVKSWAKNEVVVTHRISRVISRARCLVTLQRAKLNGIKKM